MNTLTRQANSIQDVFLGLARAWAKQVGFPFDDLDPPMMSKIDEIYVPLVDELFWKKGSS
ncbi:hypothetical protein BIWAKO_04685 [Bosea sp. BIWAKO-01]|nr:hypothetical protein BIWAKO_04685 [Bosea sp. BIWAKO-01]